MISVIVPVYNVRPFLTEAIESVIAQSYTDWEMILVDDGSTDGCGEICDTYSSTDSRIKVIHQVNGGLSAARNAGLDICKGKYIAFLDSDDAYYPEALSESVKAMKEHDADIVEFNIRVFETSGKLDTSTTKGIRGINKAKEGVYTKRETLSLQVAGSISTAVWNKLYKRRIWDGLRFSNGKNYEDMDIILQVLEKSERHCLLSDPLIAYRVRPDSISFTKSLSNLKDYTQAFNNYTGFIESHIPEYFTLSQLESVHRSNFNHLVFEYCTCSLSWSQGRQETLEYLKKEADRCKEKINVNKCPFRSRAGYLLMSSFPWATAQVFKSYRWIKKIFSSIKL
ncbi:MAG: glycosyltransferase family 2 protein [Bacteroidales bacterium]|nr:glycosyltransferase family 2 protein [Bacteroidales bacterium]MBQ2493190.1 glycosyltransferase family 2 protein [Bacteroidales bacterium]